MKRIHMAAFYHLVNILNDYFLVIAPTPQTFRWKAPFLKRLPLSPLSNNEGELINFNNKAAGPTNKANETNGLW